jgi:hypothetical protein
MTSNQSVQIRTADDEQCGVQITLTSDGYAVSGIETHHEVGITTDAAQAAILAGEYLISYGTEGLDSFTDPDTGETVHVDWSATVAQGEEMVRDAASMGEDIERALRPW